VKRGEEKLSDPVSSVIVVGAGVAGLNAALALQARGFRVTILERDPAPPPDAEMDWRRRGVPHSVHPHFLMGRLRKLFCERHPRLMERMRAAGVAERPFEEYLHPFHRDRYRPEPGDRVLTALAARRTSFERLLRQHVEEERIATLVCDANVTGLVFAEGAVPLRVCGVDAEVAGEPRRYQADVVIDASGRTGRLGEMLEAAGARFEAEHHDCRLLYFTRVYRLRPGRVFPPLIVGLPAQLFPDFIAGALPADNGFFTVTMQIHEGDTEFIAFAKDADRFHALCSRLAAIREWLSPETAEPQGGVHGFGMMDAFWRSMVVGGEPQVAGFFFLGDTAIRSNPKFGRGCTWGAVSAHLLADILAEERDPRERVLRYQRTLEREFRADWQTMVANDRTMRHQFELATGRGRSTLRDRLLAALETRVNEASVVDPKVFRAIWTGYHGITGMAAWTHRLGVWLRLLRFLAFGPGKFRSVIEQRRWRPSREEIFAMQPTGGGNR
jgi:2-polyprenyl-6-methoxyphenol hydroxylase-like FAD-dependent oxidoreductase